MVDLKTISPQEIRNAILDVIRSFDDGIGSEELKPYVMESITDSSHVDMENDMLIQRNLHDLFESDKITLDDGVYKINKNKKQDDSDYFLHQLESPFDDITMLEGNTIIYSVGSQYYQDAWSSLKVGKTIIVELILERVNPFDSNAVAVCYKNNILGHLTRSDAADYHSSIELANNFESTINVYGEIVQSKQDMNYHYLKLFMPTPDKIKTLFKD